MHSTIELRHIIRLLVVLISENKHDDDDDDVEALCRPPVPCRTECVSGRPFRWTFCCSTGIGCSRGW